MEREKVKKKKNHSKLFFIDGWMISICQHWRDYPQHFLFNSQESKQKHLIDITCAMNHVI